MVKESISNDSSIEIHDVTNDVDSYYSQINCLLVTSTNEVTPMVIPEAMSWGIPILSTNIAGIPEMFSHNVEGFLFSPNDTLAAVSYMNKLYTNKNLCRQMGIAGKAKFSKTFDLNIMIEKYRQCVFDVAPPVILLDMDGVLVDWDAGFANAWGDRSVLQREKSYYMEKCVDVEYYTQAEDIIVSKGFFENLPPMEGSLEAVRQMSDFGLKLVICTSPILKSQYCVQEKLNWILKYLGKPWLEDTIICTDKTTIRGDLLIDDKPLEYLAPGGKHTTASWKQVIFDAPYNRETTIPRLKQWKDWKLVLLPLLGKSQDIDPYLMEYGECLLPRINGSKLPQPLRRLGPAEYNARKIREVALSRQGFFLGGMRRDGLFAPSQTSLSEEDIASIVGSGSFFLDKDHVELIEDCKEELSYVKDTDKCFQLSAVLNPTSKNDEIVTISNDLAKHPPLSTGAISKFSIFFDPVSWFNSARLESGKEKVESAQNLKSELFSQNAINQRLRLRNIYRMFRQENQRRLQNPQNS